MKTHVKLSAADTKLDIPACAFNARHYKHLPASKVLSPKEFRAAPAADRCAHCTALYMLIRNKQRKAKGMPPVASPFEGLE